MEELEKTNEKMSSKRIAEKTGKDHSHVIRDIGNMIDELLKDDPNLDDSDYQIVKDNRGYVSEIVLNERLSLCLASGYSIKLRMAIIDDWALLKSQQVSLPQTFAQALQLAADQAKKIEDQQKVIEYHQPKVEAHDLFMESGHALSMEEAAKCFSMGRNTFIKKLVQANLLIPTSKLPYQIYLTMGIFRVKVVATGIGNVSQVFVTPKGMDYLSNKKCLI